MANKNPERRKSVMTRSIRLGHCVCNPKQPCPCPIFTENDVCQCAGEKLERELPGDVRLTQHVKKAGCASKISQADLRKVIDGLPSLDDPRVLVGVNACDDAGVFLLKDGVALVQTVDVFSPIVDDPYVFGRIAAANSLSDVYAMGGVPHSAMTIIGFPIESMNATVMGEILRGGIDVMREAGVAIVGGHSINDEEVKCGYSVTGAIDPAHIIGNGDAKPGDHLVLTKPLGTGVIAFAAQIGRAPRDLAQCAEESMTTLNKTASELMVRHGAHACTDVTGFGFLGHLAEMTHQSNVSVHIDASRVPFFAGAADLTRDGVMGGGVDANRAYSSQFVQIDEGIPEEAPHLLYDPQTSGGLLVALAPEAARDFVRDLHKAGIPTAAVIGEVVAAEKSPIQIQKGTGELNLHGPRAPRQSGEQPAAPPSSPTNDSELSCCASGTATTQSEATPETPPQVAQSSEKIQTSPAAGSTQPGDIEKTFSLFMKTLNGPRGAIDVRTKKIMAIALAAVTRCEPCLKIHIKSARQMGLTPEEIDEAIWMAVSFGGAPIKMFYEAMKPSLDSAQ